MPKHTYDLVRKQFCRRARCAVRSTPGARALGACGDGSGGSSPLTPAPCPGPRRRVAKPPRLFAPPEAKSAMYREARAAAPRSLAFAPSAFQRRGD